MTVKIDLLSKRALWSEQFLLSFSGWSLGLPLHVVEFLAPCVCACAWSLMASWLRCFRLALRCPLKRSDGRKVVFFVAQKYKFGWFYQLLLREFRVPNVRRDTPTWYLSVRWMARQILLFLRFPCIPFNWFRFVMVLKISSYKIKSRLKELFSSSCSINALFLQRCYRHWWTVSSM